MTLNFINFRSMGIFGSPLHAGVWEAQLPSCVHRRWGPAGGLCQGKLRPETNGHGPGSEQRPPWLCDFMPVSPCGDKQLQAKANHCSEFCL